jgi:hypothetical protein
MKSNHLLEILKRLKEYDDYIVESTSTKDSGSYKGPLSPGFRLWEKDILEPFTIPLNKYDDAQVYTDSLDGKIDTKEAKIKEKIALAISKSDKRHPVLNDDDGSDLNDSTAKITGAAKTGTADKAAGGEDDLEVVVFIVDKEGNVKKVKVTTAIQDINYIEITEGLKEGDEVVTGPYDIVSKTLKDSVEVKKVDKKELFEKK